MLNPYVWYRKYVVLEDCSDYNPKDAKKASKTKSGTKEFFKKQKIPHAAGISFYNPFSALSFAKKHSYPFVIKPDVGGFSRGSFFPLRSKKELLKAAFKVKFYWLKSVIEEYLEGRNYRVVAAYGKIVAVTRRHPAHVVGNGKSTVLQLIKRENKIRKRMKLYPVMHPISPKAALADPEYIPKKGEYVRLGNKVSLASGGILENLDIRIPKKNAEMLLSTLSALNANVFGIDIICEDITKDFDKQKCIFLELNSRPYLIMHKYSRNGNHLDLEKTINEMTHEKRN